MLHLQGSPRGFRLALNTKFSRISVFSLSFKFDAAVGKIFLSINFPPCHKRQIKSEVLPHGLFVDSSSAVASNRPTEALASVISFTFVVYSHYKHS